MPFPETEIEWLPCFRIIANRYPPVSFFETISAAPEDWEFLEEVAKLTEPALDIGDLSQLEPADRIAGPGPGLILPSFTFKNPEGTRFSTSVFGAYYAAGNLITAIIETVHHRTVFMQATNEPAQDLDQLLILADLHGTLHDIRTMKNELPEIYNQSDYARSQLLAAELRSSGSLGICYQSVRNPGGECVAVWRARVLSKAREDRHLTYHWDGSKITGYFDKSNYEILGA